MIEIVDEESIIRQFGRGFTSILLTHSAWDGELPKQSERARFWTSGDRNSVLGPLYKEDPTPRGKPSYQTDDGSLVLGSSPRLLIQETGPSLKEFALIESYVLLLGAGTSVPAGKPTIDQLSEGFALALNRPELKELAEAYNLVKTVVQKKEGRFDVELALQALTELTEGSRSVIQHFHGELDGRVSRVADMFPQLKLHLKRYIRERCQDPGDVRYLRPLLLGFMGKDGLDIFSLNYDPTIESLCESENTSYTDGFDPDWNPSTFEQERFRVRLYKIHGSVFWFRKSPGRYVKVPVKGDLQNLKFFTGEELSEMVLYPVLEKQAESGPYPYILDALRRKLAQAGLIITIGYSFRDRNIRNLLTEQMRANPHLWLLLASPHAESHRRDLCQENPDLATRIVAFDADAESAVRQRKLAETVHALTRARSDEEDAIQLQASIPGLVDYAWQSCLQAYKSLHHHERVRNIGREILLSGTFQRTGTAINSMFFDLSLRFGVECLERDEITEAVQWLEFFRDCCIVADEQLQQRFYSFSSNDGNRSEVKSVTTRPDNPDWIRTLYRIRQEPHTVFRELASQLAFSLESAIRVRDPLGKEVLQSLKAIGELGALFLLQKELGEDTLSFEKRAGELILGTIRNRGGGLYSNAQKLLDLVVRK